MPPSSSDPSYPIEAETFCGTLAQVAASQGDAAAVAILAEAEPSIELSDVTTDWGRDYAYYTLRLVISADLYGRISEHRAKLADRLKTLAREISDAHFEDQVLSAVTIAPDMREVEGWRASAKGWLRGEGISNQGRVRSDNIAARMHDGLLFRSEPEVHLYEALKARGVYMAPLPVFLRGGSTYQRLEPDFVLIHRGVLVVVEVDGATVHRESPVEAHARTQGLQREGVRIERVAAKDCASRPLAEQTAARLMDALESYQKLRG